MPVYNTMQKSTVAVSHLVPSGDVELLPPRVQTGNQWSLRVQSVGVGADLGGGVWGLLGMQKKCIGRLVN